MIKEGQGNLIESEQISLKEIFIYVKNSFKYVLSKWIFILFSVILGAVSGVAYSLLKKVNYTAITSFVLEDDNTSSLGNIAGLASMAGIDIGSGGNLFQGDNILQLYKSRSMIEKTLLSPIDSNSKILLIDEYIAYMDLKNKWKDKPNLLSVEFNKTTKDPAQVRLRDSLLREIVRELNKTSLNVYKPDKKLSEIKVEVVAKDEFFAKNFNQALVKTVNDFYIQTKTKKSLKNVIILQSKVDSVRRVMNNAIFTAVSITDATPNLNPTRQVQRVAPVQKAQFSAETNKAVLGELLKNLEISKISLLKETPLIQVVDEPIFPLENDKVKMLKGAAFGILIFGFLAVIFLLIKLFFKNIFSDKL